MKKITIYVLSIFMLLFMPYANASTKPVNIKKDKFICKTIKQKYKSEVMVEWANGLASDKDVLEEIKSNIKIISSKQKIANGKMKLVIDSWIIAEKNTQSALINKDIKEITNATNLKIKTITEFNKICEKK